MPPAAIAPLPPDVSRPLWSVMIPTHEPDLECLRQAVDSVLSAGLSPLEQQIAIVDDGALTPARAGFTEEMRARGIEVVRSASPSGLPALWNRCVTHARGRWVHILRPEHRVRPGFYGTLADGIGDDLRVGAAVSRVAMVDEKGQERRAAAPPACGAGVLEQWVEHVVVNPAIESAGIVVRRAAYERLGGFDSSYVHCAEHDMWQRIACEYPVWYEPRPLAECRAPAIGPAHRRPDLARRWREQSACLHAGVRRLPPPVRDLAARRGRRLLLRRAVRELAAAWKELRPAARTSALWHLCRLGGPSDVLGVWRHCRPVPLPSRAPARGLDPSRPRLPRVLLLSEFFPYDAERAVYGAFQRLRQDAEALARLGPLDAVFFWWGPSAMSPEEGEELRSRDLHAWPITGRVFRIPSCDPPQSELRERPLRSLWYGWRGALSFFHHLHPTLRNSGLRQARLLGQALRECQPDLIFAHTQGAFAALLCVGPSLPPTVVDMPDLEHVRVARLAPSDCAPMPWWRRRWLIWLARRAVRTAIAASQTTVVCSAHDRSIAQRLVPTARIEVIPNTARVTRHLPPAPAATALFVGTAGYAPNATAILFLVREVWPRVRRRVPEARLTIVGEGAAELVPEPQPGCTILGFVAELEDVYREARLGLCPITSGGGTRIKIIEAAMYGRPVVSTTVGAEGLDFAPGSEIVIADGVQAFADACADLLLDPSRCEQLGRGARRRALDTYAPERAVSRLVEILSQHVHAP